MSIINKRNKLYSITRDVRTATEVHRSPYKPIGKLLLPLAMVMGASTASAAVLEEVIVTAQKRAQSLQDVPISVQAVTGDTIEDAGIQRLEDLAAYVPNVHITEGFAGEIISVRGFGSGGNPSFEQAVATFIDGVYFGRAKQSLASFLDIERVEVLRGPQSTFFGNNAIAGALNIGTRRPTEETEGSISVSYAPDDNEVDTTITYGGMISDTVGARVAIKHRTIDGYLKLWDGGATPEKDTLVGRISLLWEASDNLEVFFKAEKGSEDTTGSTAQLVDCPSVHVSNTPGIGNGLCSVALAVTGLESMDFDEVIETGGLNARPGINPQQNIVPVLAQEGGEFRNLDTENYNLTLDYDLDNYTLTSVTGITAYESDRQFDVDNTPIASISTNRQEDFEQFSQEFRIVSPGGETIDWLAGVYYQTNEVDFAYQTYTLLPPPDATGFQGGTLGLVAGDFKEDADTWAAFASGTLNVSDDFNVTLGLRYAEVEKKGSSDLNLYITGNNTAVPILANPIPALGAAFTAFEVNDVKVNEEKVTGNLNASWHATEEVMLYGTYSRGFKAGGFDNLIRKPASQGGNFTFDTEEVEALEFGAKMDWGSTRLNLALFRNEFTDLQQSIFSPAAIAFIIDNVGSAVSQGVEADFMWAATDNLTISASAAILDAYYESFEGASCSAIQALAGATSCSLTGEALPFAADWNTVLNFDHRIPVGDGLELNTQLTVAYTDEYRTGVETDPRYMQDAFETVDFRVSLSDIDDTWTVALWGKNLTDELVIGNSTNAAVRSVGSILSTTGRPLSWGISGSYNF